MFGKTLCTSLGFFLALFADRPSGHRRTDSKWPPTLSIAGAAQLTRHRHVPAAV